jgi:DNA-binding NtrC family response regulator
MPEKTTPNPARPPLFLIVDDEPDGCWALEHILTAEGHRTKKAFTAEQAFNLIGQHRFVMAFVDAKLPDADGFDLARRIRDRDPAMRIILVSGFFYLDDVAVQKALTEGVIQGFLGKPFLHADILRAVESAIIE